MSQLYYSSMSSPVGELLLAGDGEALHLLGFSEGSMQREAQSGWLPRNSVFTQVKKQLQAYFAGELQRFSVPLAPQGSAFQQKVWRAMLDIPYGETRSYAELAEKIGHPAAVRAVGAASGRNPIPLIIPCHRVIGSNGALVGFGGGLRNKQYLLSLEQASIPFTLG